jgi:DNA polymerase III subunit epsilon
MKNKIQDTKYAIIDIETTGGMPKRDKIIEIAIVIYDGSQIIDQFTSLVNPDRSIPYEITRITGIDDSMVVDAPRFFEIAKQIVLMTTDTVFVAHNVNFDYGFIREEFDKLGYTFTRKQLCTVRLSRKTFFGLPSYSLGNLIKHFGINVNARHRALDDALATTIIFGKILDSQNENIEFIINKEIKSTKLPEAITLERIHSLPEKAGVYYFYDSYGTIIYVGKSKNIQSRIGQHFSQLTAKSEKLIRQTKDLDFTVTGSELIALLLESEQIKIINPSINKAQKTKNYPYYIYTYEDQFGYIIFGINKSTKKLNGNEKLLSFQGSFVGAKSRLAYMRDAYTLCEEKFNFVGESQRTCLFYTMASCYGACKKIESSDAYNERAEVVKSLLMKMFDEDFIIVVEGRNSNEKGLILIEDGSYKGYGYIDTNDVYLGVEEMKEAIETRYCSPESNQIIIQYLKENKVEKIIKF